jgi:ribosomal protein S18 acetylase RimI-like enzyme
MGTIPLTMDRLEAVTDLVARLQPAPAHHIAYLSAEPGAIHAELAGLEPDPVAAGAVVLDGGAVIGALLAEWDQQPPRAWWYGPYVDASGAAWHDAADALYAACRPRLPASVTQEELAADAAHATIAAFAARHGFVLEEGSSVLHLGELPLEGPDGGLDIAESESVPADVAGLHDACFPGAHRTGAGLPGEGGVLLVARRVGRLVGYAVAEIQPSGQGYLDFVGVEPTMRRRGAGRSLVVATARALANHGCMSLHLTVREANLGAGRGRRPAGRRARRRRGGGSAARRSGRAWRRSTSRTSRSRTRTG